MLSYWTDHLKFLIPIYAKKAAYASVRTSANKTVPDIAVPLTDHVMSVCVVPKGEYMITVWSVEPNSPISPRAPTMASGR